MKKIKLPGRRKMKKIAITFYGIFVAAFGCLLPPSSQAEVHVVRCDPPLSLDAFSDPAPGLDWNTTAFDFDLDGQPDFRLTYGAGVMTAYFNFPTSFAIKATLLQTLPGGTASNVIPAPWGPLAAVPLNSVIGSNFVSSVKTNFYNWSTGYTNNDNLPELLGDHETIVIAADLVIPVVPPLQPQPVISLSTNGFVTNTYYPHFPLIIGDINGKEGVMALQFYTGSERHYGYIHFDFNGGTGGVIYGWAYETEPDVPIKAEPLLPGEKITAHRLLVNPFGDTPKHGH